MSTSRVIPINFNGSATVFYPCYFSPVPHQGGVWYLTTYRFIKDNRYRTFLLWEKRNHWELTIHEGLSFDDIMGLGLPGGVGCAAKLKVSETHVHGVTTYYPDLASALKDVVIVVEGRP